MCLVVSPFQLQMFNVRLMAASCSYGRGPSTLVIVMEKFMGLVTSLLLQKAQFSPLSNNSFLIQLQKIKKVTAAVVLRVIKLAKEDPAIFPIP